MTELMWEGKYVDGKKTAPVRLALPFQDVETVNESSQTRNLMLDLWGRGEEREWRNRLIWGDKKYVLPSLLPEFAGKVNLIYIDPPFNTGDYFAFIADVPDNPDIASSQSTSFVKEPSMIEQKAYRDTWGRGLDSYLQWFFETVVLLNDLLADNGSIYVHLDWHIGHYAKAVLDEVFGTTFKNEIIWHYLRWPAKSPLFQRSHDTLFWYGKSDKHTWNQQYQELSAATIKRFGGKKVRGETTKEVLPEESLGAPMRDVWDIPHVLGANPERVHYPTQKPEALLERIINASSNEGDLVLDCFCGSGTTAAVAEKLGRRWITCDLGRFAIHTTRKRLLGIDNVRPFVVQNLGKYERQAWQAAEFGGDKERAAQAQAHYRRFILDLYGAEPLDGYTWLHGLKAGHLVHVGSVDAPVLNDDIKAIAREFWKAAGKGSGARTNSVDILGWDFAFELNELGKQLAAESNINLVYKRIPREVLEKKAVEQGDIRFFELAALQTNVTVGKQRTVTIELDDFVVHPDDVPEEIQHAITHWSQLIDYWAVDWDYRGDTFHNQWQSYRTKKSPRLQLSVAHLYEVADSYTILVKVIDILGNDTTKSIQIEVQ